MIDLEWLDEAENLTSTFNSTGNETVDGRVMFYYPGMTHNVWNPLPLLPNDFEYFAHPTQNDNISRFRQWKKSTQLVSWLFCWWSWWWLSARQSTNSTFCQTDETASRTPTLSQSSGSWKVSATIFRMFMYSLFQMNSNANTKTDSEPIFSLIKKT